MTNAEMEYWREEVLTYEYDYLCENFGPTIIDMLEWTGIYYDGQGYICATASNGDYAIWLCDEVISLQEDSFGYSND